MQTSDWRRGFFDWMKEKSSANQAHENSKRTNQNPRLDHEIVFVTVISPVPCIYQLNIDTDTVTVFRVNLFTDNKKIFLLQ